MGNEDDKLKSKITEPNESRALVGKALQYLSKKGVQLLAGANIWDLLATHIKTLAPVPQETFEADNLVTEMRAFLMRNAGLSREAVEQYSQDAVCSAVRQTMENLKMREHRFS